MDSQFSSMAISESQNTPFRSHFRLRKASQTLRFRFRFAMDLPTRFACMARLVAKITPDPWLIIKLALHDAPLALFPSDFGKYFANGWERRSANNSSSHFIELNVEAGKKLVNTTVFHSFLVVVAVVNRFPFHSFEAINRDSSANILMISSSVPRVFCAGADLKVLADMIIVTDLQERKTMSSSEVQAFVNSLRSTFSYLEALHIPTIAVIEGAALGGGLEMALSCNLWICGEDAVLGLPETGLAIIPGAGGTQWLPRLVGRSVAKELIFCGRKVGGRDAVSMGLVNHCVPAGEAHLKALEIARNINQKGPLALRMAKRAINEGLDVYMASALALEEECYEQLLNTKDRLEGLEAFAEKRTPKYTGYIRESLPKRALI
ncbi:hypothetical protein HYC85_012033 [Camellia sinensis]|uniref:Enoyl-CoA hydratase n=1 Tax=Camellia sinensis TaxID=4442 RepID=A0A7J7HAS9_CAMSI|nr:hypothetical protein HYC85_012033 [Camellia sinensis]